MRLRSLYSAWKTNAKLKLEAISAGTILLLKIKIIVKKSKKVSETQYRFFPVGTSLFNINP